MYRNDKKIAVLLATFNGARYIGAQLESLSRQSCDMFHIFIRDDGSSDSTVQLVNDFAQSHPGLVTVVEDGEKHLGAAKSFMRLLSEVDSDYYMFCDQDDVWLDFKIEKTFARMQQVENGGKPVVVATDLKVVDENLNTVKESFNADLKIDVFRKHPQLICVRHVVTGCTMMFNRYAKMASLPMSDLATMHDEWVALCVHFKGGIIEIIDEATICYRQHSSNTLGANQATRGIFDRALAQSGREQFKRVAKLLGAEFGVSFPRFLLYKILYSWL